MNHHSPCALGLVHKLLGLLPGELVSSEVTVGSGLLVHGFAQLQISVKVRKFC